MCVCVGGCVWLIALSPLFTMQKRRRKAQNKTMYRMSVWISVCTCGCVHVHVYLWVCTWHVYLWVCACACVLVGVYMCMCTCGCAHGMCTCGCAPVYMCVRIHTMVDKTDPYRYPHQYITILVSLPPISAQNHFKHHCNFEAK